MCFTEKSVVFLLFTRSQISNADGNPRDFHVQLPTNEICSLTAASSTNESRVWLASRSKSCCEGSVMRFLGLQRSLQRALGQLLYT